MTRIASAAAVVITIGVALGAAAAQRVPTSISPDSTVGAGQRMRLERDRFARELNHLEHQYLRWPEDRELFADAARRS